MGCFALEQKMQSAGWVADIERWESDTDSDGSAEGNLDLSKRRARAVLEALVSRGVEAERLESEGFGETKPIADNKTRAGKAQNRRVELAIIDQ